jgi:hypothetical protein
MEPRWAHRFASSSGNASFRCLPSLAETKTLNLHHRCRPASSNRLTPTLHWYKKVIPTLATPLTTQSCLYFASSLTRAPCHRSSSPYHRSLSLPAHAHRPSTQWHTWWWTSRPSFTSRTPRWGFDRLSCSHAHLQWTVSSSPPQVHTVVQHQVAFHDACTKPTEFPIQTILEFHENSRTLHLAPYF